jgi:hypothetical protein
VKSVTSKTSGQPGKARRLQPLSAFIMFSAIAEFVLGLFALIFGLFHEITFGKILLWISPLIIAIGGLWPTGIYTDPEDHSDKADK